MYYPTEKKWRGTEQTAVGCGAAFIELGDMLKFSTKSSKINPSKALPSPIRKLYISKMIKSYK